MRMTKRQRVYNKYSGHCAYCGKEIKIEDMQIDHIVPQKQHGSDDIENLNPSCRLCNHYKRAKNIEQYRKYISTLIERVKKIYIVRVALKYDILKSFDWSGKFYFETQGVKNEYI
nr:MAG TPA: RECOMBINATION ENDONUCLEASE VII [Caudoviricetes sp.]